MSQIHLLAHIPVPACWIPWGILSCERTGVLWFPPPLALVSLPGDSTMQILHHHENHNRGHTDAWICPQQLCCRGEQQGMVKSRLKEQEGRRDDLAVKALGWGSEHWDSIPNSATDFQYGFGQVRSQSASLFPSVQWG